MTYKFNNLVRYYITLSLGLDIAIANLDKFRK